VAVTDDFADGEPMALGDSVHELGDHQGRIRPLNPTYSQIVGS
jgi:hypothetical protein